MQSGSWGSSRRRGGRQCSNPGPASGHVWHDASYGGSCCGLCVVLGGKGSLQSWGGGWQHTASAGYCPTHLENSRM